MTHAPFFLRARAARIVLVVGALAGCRNLSNFDSKPGEAYCGTIGAPDFQDGFVKLGSPPNLQLALTLDTSKITSNPDSPRLSEPGILRSKDLDGLCGSNTLPRPLFQDAPLRAIPELEHDVLSTLTFGEGHEQDFFAWVDSTCQGTMLAVVSLMKNNQVELRLFKPAALPPAGAPPAQRPGFAVFHLDPKPLYKSSAENGCGFPVPE